MKIQILNTFFFPVPKELASISAVIIQMTMPWQNHTINHCVTMGLYTHASVRVPDVHKANVSYWPLAINGYHHCWP